MCTMIHQKKFPTFVLFRSPPNTHIWIINQLIKHTITCCCHCHYISLQNSNLRWHITDCLCTCTLSISLMTISQQLWGLLKNCNLAAACWSKLVASQLKSCFSSPWVKSCWHSRSRTSWAKNCRNCLFLVLLLSLLLHWTSVSKHIRR